MGRERKRLSQKRKAARQSETAGRELRKRIIGLSLVALGIITALGLGGFYVASQIQEGQILEGKPAILAEGYSVDDILSSIGAQSQMTREELIQTALARMNQAPSPLGSTLVKYIDNRGEQRERVLTLDGEMSVDQPQTGIPETKFNYDTSHKAWNVSYGSYIQIVCNEGAISVFEETLKNQEKVRGIQETIFTMFKNDTSQRSVLVLSFCSPDDPWFKQAPSFDGNLTSPEITDPSVPERVIVRRVLDNPRLTTTFFTVRMHRLGEQTQEGGMSDTQGLIEVLTNGTSGIDIRQVQVPDPNDPNSYFTNTPSHELITSVIGVASAFDPTDNIASKFLSNKFRVLTNIVKEMTHAAKR